MWLGRNSKDGYTGTVPTSPAASGLTVTAVDDTTDNTNTIVQVSTSAGTGNKFVYKTTAGTITTPKVGDVLTGWTDLPGTGSIAANDGEKVYVAEVKTATNKVVKFGSATAVVTP